MSKYLVMFLAPPAVLDAWSKADPIVRKEAEEKMQGEWKKWTNSHAKMFADAPTGLGKTKCIDDRGISDTKNDNMLYAIIEAKSHEAAAKAFEGHPHLQIPQATIEVMELRSAA